MNERERLVRSAQRGIDVARELAREGFLISAIVNLSDAVELALGCVPDGPSESKAQPTPVPMLLWCPECFERHVDAGDFSAKPHHTHACQGCGNTWRPAVVPTVGVQFLPGFKDDPPEPGNVECTHLERVACRASGVVECMSCGAEWRQSNRANPPEQPAPIVLWVVAYPGDAVVVLQSAAHAADLAERDADHSARAAKLIEEKPFKRDLAKRLREIAKHGMTWRTELYDLARELEAGS